MNPPTHPKSRPDAASHPPQTGLSRWTRHFWFHGRRFSLVKRRDSRDAPYGLDSLIDGRRHKIALKANDVHTATAKAKLKLAPILDGSWQPPEPSAATLVQIFSQYDRLAMIDQRSVKNNKLAVLKVCEIGAGVRDPLKIDVSLFSAQLVRDYQAAVVARYAASAPADKAAQREGRQRALRTSKSTFNQAKSVFQPGLVEGYRAAGLVIPSGVIEFHAGRAQGKLQKPFWRVPSSDVVEKTFKAVEQLRPIDFPAYLLFWLAIGTCMRREELANLQWSDLLVREGQWWINGGIGKDGNAIYLPCLAGVGVLLASIRPAKSEGYVLPGDERMRRETIPGRLNYWLRCQGWQGTKKLHDLRAWAGSQLYEANPRMAQAYLRHKSLQTTEGSYSHHARLEAIVDVLEKVIPFAPTSIKRAGE